MLKRIAINAGLQKLSELAEPSSVDKIDKRTALAINQWCLNYPNIQERPFPNAADGDNVLSDVFSIHGWGRVWFQRSFWLHYSTRKENMSVVVKIRWIIGRDSPQDVALSGDLGRE
ncbi:MAG: hypothetical protein AAGA46_00270 [Cyanobacteria bacterium P01_F01_bin.13]